MIKPNIPENDKERIKALHNLNILDTLEEDAYDQLTLLTSQICDVPISLVSLVDSNRQWFKSHNGLDVRETPRDLAFCAHAINKPNEILVVEDATKDIRFYNNPLCVGAPNVIFYAGAPLNTSDGFCLGTLCIIDKKPRNLSLKQRTALKAIADQVSAQLELRRKKIILIEKIKTVKKLNNDLETFSYQLSHSIQEPMRDITYLIEFLKENDIDKISISLREIIEQIDKSANYGLALLYSSINYINISKKNINFSEFNLEDIAKHVFNNSVNTTNVKLELINCNRTILTSKYAIQLVFQNLMSDSLKFSNKDTCIISISSKIENDRLFIDYKDNGPGIKIKYAYKIFEIFKTLNSKSENSLGLGLAMVKKVLSKLSGNIRLIDSESNEGVHFKIDLPLKIQ